MVAIDIHYGLTIYPNLARGMTLTGLKQHWVADLTHIRLVEAGFIAGTNRFR